MQKLRNIGKNDGFTLIEILVVIGIIAILAAIVLVALNPARQFAQARNTDRTSNVNALLNAVGQYIADNGGDLPSDLTQPLATSDISGAALPDLCNDLVSEYLPALPTDPNATSTNGAAIEEADCGGYPDTGYDVSVDANGRVTVSAPLTELSTTSISVTR